MQFADLQPGMVITSGPRSVSAEEIIEFAKRYDPQWFHLDPERAKSSRWNGLIGSGWMTCSIAMELAVAAVLSDSDSIGSPGLEYIKWPHPVRPGDELTLRIEVLASRLSRSSKLGIVRWRWLLTTQPGATVLDLIATSLFDTSAKFGAMVSL